MKLISSKIAEIVDEALTTNSEIVVWRGVLDTQEWKIITQYETESAKIIIKVMRRDGGDGEPE